MISYKQITQSETVPCQKIPDKPQYTATQNIRRFFITGIYRKKKTQTSEKTITPFIKFQTDIQLKIIYEV